MNRRHYLAVFQTVIVSLFFISCSSPGEDTKCEMSYTDYGDGECRPIDPCADNTTCTAEYRACVNNLGSAKCGDCIAGYHEEASTCVEDTECNPNTCNNHGTCDQSSGKPVCSCEDEYAGDNCETCAQNFTDYGDGLCKPESPCADDTTCAAEHRECDNNLGSAQCGDCIAGYYEEANTCVTNAQCEANTCNNHGTCDQSSGAPVCNCEDEYAGDHCETCAEGYEDDGNGECRPADSFLSEELIDAICSKMATCGDLFAGAAPTEAECIDMLSQTPEELGVDLDQLSDMDLIIDEEKALECIDQLECGFLTGESAFPEVCMQVIYGTKAEGECCYSQELCGPGLYCKIADIKQSEQGVCEKMAQEGESCQNKQLCAPPLVCGKASKKCKALKVVDQSCLTNADCYSDRCKNLKCIPRIKVGEACPPANIRNNSCIMPSMCIKDENTSTGTCRLMAKIGDACTPAKKLIKLQQLTAPLCQMPESFCNSDTKICEPLPNTVGQDCSDSFLCEPMDELFCDMTVDGMQVDGTCQRFVEDDMPCDPTKFLQCRFNSACDPVTKTCVPKANLYCID